MMNFLITALAFAAGALLARRAEFIPESTESAPATPTPVPAPTTTPKIATPLSDIPAPTIKEEENQITMDRLRFEASSQSPRYYWNIPQDEVEQDINRATMLAVNMKDNDRLYAGTVPDNYPELLEAKIDQAILAEIIAERKKDRAA